MFQVISFLLIIYNIDRVILSFRSHVFSLLRISFFFLNRKNKIRLLVFFFFYKSCLFMYFISSFSYSSHFYSLIFYSFIYFSKFLFFLFLVYLHLTSHPLVILDPRGLAFIHLFIYSFILPPDFSSFKIVLISLFTWRTILLLQFYWFVFLLLEFPSPLYEFTGIFNARR